MCNFGHQKGFGNVMKLIRLDLELKLLLVAIGTCIWGAALLIHPEFGSISVDAVTVVVIGEIFALWCSDKGPHSIAMLAVLSICFATQSVAFFSHDRHFLPSAFCAIVAVYCTWRAFEKFRKTSGEGMTSTVSPSTDSVLQSACGGTAPFKLPMMPVRDMVIVPGMRTPFVVGRESSVRALEYAEANNVGLFLATQHDDAVDAPRATEISKFGCVCRVLQCIKMTDGDFKGNFKVLVEGVEMAKAVAIDDSRGFFFATVQNLNVKGEAVPITPAA